MKEAYLMGFIMGASVAVVSCSLYGLVANKQDDYQLIDKAIYECSRQKKIEVSFKENKEGDCTFIAMAAE